LLDEVVAEGAVRRLVDEREAGALVDSAGGDQDVVRPQWSRAGARTRRSPASVPAGGLTPRPYEPSLSEPSSRRTEPTRTPTARKRAANCWCARRSAAEPAAAPGRRARRRMGAPPPRTAARPRRGRNRRRQARAFLRARGRGCAVRRSERRDAEACGPRPARSHRAAHRDRDRRRPAMRPCASPDLWTQPRRLPGRL
jgi:hypothetical protein